MTWETLAAWGEEIEVVGPIGGGARNEVIRVVVDGRRCVARRGSRSGPVLRWEVELLEHLHQVGVPVPRIVPTADGRAFVDDTVVMEEVSGDAPTEDPVSQLIGTLHRVHEATAGWPQRPGFASSTELLDRDRGGDVDLTTMPTDAVDLCRHAWSQLPDVAPTAVHGDPNPGNVVSAGDRLVLVDWDEARVDHPWLDLAAVGPEDSGLSAAESRLAYRAAVAWETATCWSHEPTYARRRLDELRALSS